MTDRGASRRRGWHRLDPHQRLADLASWMGADPGELRSGTEAFTVDLADRMVENVVGLFPMPLAVAPNFLVDGRDYMVPMVVEEPSVVAAAGNGARMVRAGGGFWTTVSRPVGIAQIQLATSAPEEAKAALEASRGRLLAMARELMPRMVERGGGPLELVVRIVPRPDSGAWVVVHLLVDVRDAMGANALDSLAEAMAEPLARVAGARPGLRILSNVAEHRLVTVTCRVPPEVLGSERSKEVAEAIAEASDFASADPYRAVTHNKGIMNGMDAVCLATGNDWRALEAAAHYHASVSGRYLPLSTWRVDGPWLHGRLEVPVPVGTVGGASTKHPTARMALTVLGVEAAERLAAVMGAVGLANNLAALRALATEGIQRGHMRLHRRA